MTTHVTPTRTLTPGSAHEDYIEEHPAYGVIGASRVSAGGGPYGGKALFGSDFAHKNHIVIRIGPATLRRGLSNDWVGGGRTPYVEVALSEAQWATFVSSLNIGDGVPCTVEWLSGKRVPSIARDDSRREQNREEVNQTLADALAHIDAVMASTALRKSDRERLALAKQELLSNLPYVAEQFDRHAERTVERAKMEVNAYVTSTLMRAGLGALAPGADDEGPLLALPESMTSDG